MRLTLFPDVTAGTAQAHDIAWLQLVAGCINPTVYETKRSMPLIKLSSFGDRRTARGALRHDANLLAVSGLEGDYDGGEISPESAAALLAYAGVEAVIYTTPSHTAAAPRWRVLAPLSAEVPPAGRRELMARLNGALGGFLAPESFANAQVYYIGKVAGVEYVAHHVAGACIDTLTALPAIYPASVAKAPAEPGERRTDANLDELRDALGAIPADEYSEWIAVGQALAGLGEQGFALWSEWSATSAKHDPEVDLQRWSTFAPTRTGFAAVFAKAQRAGWINPAARKPLDTSAVGFGAGSSVPAGAFPVPPAGAGADARHGTATTRPLTELGNAMRLYDLHGEQVRYVEDAKQWLVWQRAGAWTWDMEGARVRQLAAALPVRILTEGATMPFEATSFAKWSIEASKLRTVDAAVKHLSIIDGIRVPLALLDADPWLVGLDDARQVIDLKTGTVRDARPNDYITKSLRPATVGDPAGCHRWNQFLGEVLDHDVELIDWFQRWAGYLLSGSTDEQFLCVWHGHGANGKGVATGVLEHVMGDYVRTVSTETLTESNRKAGAASPDLYSLIGARFVIASETCADAHLNEGLVKSLTGQDTINCRGLYVNPVEFRPQFKMLLSSNHRPIVKGTDHGIWRRVRLIEFRRKFEGASRDAALAGKLQAEAPHILAWMVAGCLEWQRRGLSDMPAAVSAATSGYRSDMDLVGNFIDEKCDLGDGYEIRAAELYAVYQQWAVASGLRAMAKQSFGRRIDERGISSRRSSGVLYVGIKLKPWTTPT